MIGLGGIISGIGSFYSGYTTFRESGKQAEEVQYQGQVALQESLREASIIREEGRAFAASQSLQFIGAGVELVGSALITMAQTAKYAETEAQAQERAGGAKADYANSQARKLRSEGRAALIGGIVNATASFLKPGV
jgi:hypothetical protein